jgi:hypothetical protein
MFSNPVSLSTYLTLFDVYDLPSEAVYFLGVSPIIIIIIIIDVVTGAQSRVGFKMNILGS